MLELQHLFLIFQSTYYLAYTGPLFYIITFQSLVLLGLYLTFYLFIYVNIHFFPFVLFSSTLLVSPISLLKAEHLET